VQTGNEAEAVWEKLRGTRWNPPAAAAADPARRRTYVFALEQAEQMFRAASGTGVATRLSCPAFSGQGICDYLRGCLHFQQHVHDFLRSPVSEC
jgi:hypothetical protein